MRHSFTIPLASQKPGYPAGLVFLSTESDPYDVLTARASDFRSVLALYDIQAVLAVYSKHDRNSVVIRTRDDKETREFPVAPHALNRIEVAFADGRFRATIVDCLRFDNPAGFFGSFLLVDLRTGEVRTFEEVKGLLHAFPVPAGTKSSLMGDPMEGDGVGMVFARKLDERRARLVVRLQNLEGRTLAEAETEIRGTFHPHDITLRVVPGHTRIVMHRLAEAMPELIKIPFDEGEGADERHQES